MALEITKHSVVKATVSWIIAAVITSGLIWGVVLFNNRGHEARACKEKACFIILDKRMQIIELAMQCPNNNCDRFKGKDAAKMEKRFQAETDAKIDTLRKELKK